ncbi:putative ABC transporter permease subunit [Gaopeijia maritima]|uniref:putative ABC transporter permease subunit n=1 Tax=Gaopeijia maritima TaxID=3119007 RepID=UPI003247DE9D
MAGSDGAQAGPGAAGQGTRSWRFLLVPKLQIRINRARSGKGRALKTGLIGFVGLFFWTFVFAVIVRMLLYFRNTQGIGDLLAAKMLGLAFLTFFMILLLSNVITALSTFFLSDDLELLVAAPVEPGDLYGARLTETILDSSWMVALMAVPILAAYGVVYAAGPLYYLTAVVVMAAFLVLPAVLGTAFTLMLVNVFPARRTRDLLALVGLFAVAGVVVLFRFLRPERLMRPEEFRDLVDFMAVLRTPTSPWLPSEWAADALMGRLGGVPDLHPLMLLLTTAAAFVVFGLALHRRFYRSGFSKAQEGADQKPGRVRDRSLGRWLGWLDPSTRQLVEKEIRVFLRDTTQWSQLVLLGVLVVVYVYNIRQLPLHTGEQVSFVLVTVVSFLNLGLAGFVVAAVAARFVFPALSIEGRVMWLLRSSPVDVRRVFWAKYWVGTVPILAIAVPLIIGTNWLLESSPFVFALTTVSMVLITFALTALALGLGALFPNYDTENVAEIPTSFGGLLFMMSAVIYLGLVVLLQGWPVYRFLVGRMEMGAGAEVPVLIGGLGGAALLTAAAVVLPLRAGVRRVRALE